MLLIACIFDDTFIKNINPFIKDCDTMKKSRLGERPSHLKQRGTMMGLDDDLNACTPKAGCCRSARTSGATTARVSGCLKTASLYLS